MTARESLLMSLRNTDIVAPRYLATRTTEPYRKTSNSFIATMRQPSFLKLSQWSFWHTTFTSQSNYNRPISYLSTFGGFHDNLNNVLPLTISPRPIWGRIHRMAFFSSSISSSTSTTPPTVDPSVESLSSEELEIYRELSFLSDKIRRLDESYYGGGIASANATGDTAESSIIDGEATVSGETTATEIEVTDEEYDALARTEADICTRYPHILALLEKESKLGNRATRFGGRVGRLYEGAVDVDTTSSSFLDVVCRKVADENDVQVGNGNIQTNATNNVTKLLPKKKRIKRNHLLNAPMKSLDNAMDDLEVVAWLNRVRKLLLAEMDSAAEDAAGDLLALATTMETNSSQGNSTIGGNNTKNIPIEVMAEPKIDGLSLSLRYCLRDPDSTESNASPTYDFVWGATRGDGMQGEDVSEAVQSAWMRDSTKPHSHNDRLQQLSEEEEQFSIPKSFTISSTMDLTPPTTIEIRGEVVLPLMAFQELSNLRESSVATSADHSDYDKNSSNTGSNGTSAQSFNISNPSTSFPTFSNARNAASGILLRSKEKMTFEEMERTRWLQSLLRFYAYDVVASSSSKSESMKREKDSTMDGSRVDELLGNAWLEQVMGSTGAEMRNLLTTMGFCVPNPTVTEIISINSEKELNLTDMHGLREYHRSALASRNDSIVSSKPSSSSPFHDTHESKYSNNQPQIHFPYQVDGIVYKLSSLDHRKTCGSSSRTPRWAIAHKLPPQCAITRLVDVDIQVGRTGALTPVAILDPVDLGGVVISRASLHNFNFARKILLPEGDNASSEMEDDANTATIRKTNESRSTHVKKGVSVLVSRAGDVIPQVMKRIFDDHGESEILSTKEKEWISLEPPKKCPACGASTSFDIVNTPSRKKVSKTITSDNSEVLSTDDSTAVVTVDEVAQQIDESCATETGDATENGKSQASESGQVLRCSGPQLLCQPRAVGALVHAYSRTGLDVKGLSESKLRQLLEAGIVRFPADLFVAFGNRVGDEQSKGEEMLQKIADLPGWGKLSSENLANSIRAVASDGVPLSRFIYSLGIRFIGTHASQLVASSYKNVDTFLEAIDQASSYQNEQAEKEDSGGTSPQPLPFALLSGDDKSEKVKGIGPTALSSLLSFSKEKILVKAAKDLANSLTIVDDDTHNTYSKTVTTTKSLKDDNDGLTMPFEGMVVVFTGSIPGMSRTEAQNAVKERGAKSTPSSVSKSTSLVIEGDKGGKKAQKAREMGIRVIDPVQFFQLMEGK